MITIRNTAETLFIIMAGTAIGLFVMVQVNTGRLRPSFSAAVPDMITPLPTPTPSGPYEEVMDSPEGSKTLTLANEEKNESTVYSVYVSAKDETKGEPIFRQEVRSGVTWEIPYNTWAPDNAYVFLKEKKANELSYIVLKSTGDLLADDTTSLNVSALFAEKAPNFILMEITGWAAPNLLLVNTEGKDSNVKVSFWFDVPSQTFIQLGTYFK